MLKIAIYGKGGSGKSTIAAGLASALAGRGLRVMQIGCDPKADSTLLLRHGKALSSVLDLIRTRREAFTLDDMVHETSEGILCVEAGGPVPGSGCAGRGIIVALEKLEAMGAYTRFRPDVVLYDVLGDVVCGGFSMPMRRGYADKVVIVTSSEAMSIYAAANIAMAVRNFRDRGYAPLGGFILNARAPQAEESMAAEKLAADFESVILGRIGYSLEIRQAELQKRVVTEAFPDSPAALELKNLAFALYSGGPAC